MVSDTRISRTSANVGFATYDATPIMTPGDLTYSSRDRVWSRAFKGRKAALVSLLTNGYLPTLPYTDDLQEVTKGRLISAYGQMYSDPRSKFEWHFIYSANRIYVDPYDGAMNTLATAVFEKLQGKISGHGLNTAVTAFEAPKTVSMIGDAVRSLSQAYSQARHGQWSRAAKTLGLTAVPDKVSKGRSFASNWAEYRYGWRLVVYDVQSLLKTLHTQLTTRPPVYRVTAMETKLEQYKWPKTWDFNLPNGLHALSVAGFEVDEITRVVRGGYVYELESVPLATGQEFGLLNPFPFAWEVIPYSVVADWIVNVGSVLEGLTAFQGKSCLTGWINREIESRRSTFWTAVNKGSGINSLKSGITCVISEQKERRFRRSATGFTPSSLRIDIDMNISRTLDAIAFFQLHGAKSKSIRI